MMLYLFPLSDICSFKEINTPWAKGGGGKSDCTLCNPCWLQNNEANSVCHRIIMILVGDFMVSQELNSNQRGFPSPVKKEKVGG